jgi:hypothetical protein
MKNGRRSWFSIGQPGGTELCCAACDKEFDLGGPSADHHPRVCPVCGVECVFLNWKDRVVQIVMQSAPARLPELIRWVQEQFDELEYVELLCALEEVADAVKTGTEHQMQ